MEINNILKKTRNTYDIKDVCSLSKESPLGGLKTSLLEFSI
jgi:hypothetical protein